MRLSCLPTTMEQRYNLSLPKKITRTHRERGGRPKENVPAQLLKQFVAIDTVTRVVVPEISKHRDRRMFFLDAM